MIAPKKSISWLWVQHQLFIQGTRLTRVIIIKLSESLISLVQPQTARSECGSFCRQTVLLLRAFFWDMESCVREIQNGLILLIFWESVFLQSQLSF